MAVVIAGKGFVVGITDKGAGNKSQLPAPQMPTGMLKI
jgi:hypothetical protein